MAPSSLSLVLALTSTAMAASAPVGKYFDNYIFIVMENNDLVNVLKNSEYSSLISQGVEFTNYHGTTHPSQPNYWSTIAQSTFRNAVVGNYTGNGKDVGALINGDNGDDIFDLTGPMSIADTLEAAGVSWGIYSENYPGNASYCFTGAGFGTETEVDFEGAVDTNINATSGNNLNRLYKRKHNPFMSFTSINTNTARCGSHVFSEKEWAAAVKADTFPDYAYIVPNQINDAHDWPGDTYPVSKNTSSAQPGIDYSAAWLKTVLTQLNASKYLTSRRTLIHITFDENDLAYDLYYAPNGPDPSCTDLTNCPGDTTNNQVYGVLLGSAVSCYAGTTFTEHFDHNSIVATLTDNWGLAALKNSDSTGVAVWPLKSCKGTNIVTKSDAGRVKSSVLGLVAATLVSFVF
ncbi:hypothetical protein HDU98_003681 [Podochytrium sp. JEL0797]|nr:hypothetical protein HDU98_003681 [Podochytrium sp. JEL0797]